MKASELRIPFVWKDRHPILLNRCFYIPGHFKHVEKPIHFFENSNPIAIEYCSGNGQWICQKAKEFPGQNWIAVEKRFDRARKIWARLHKEGLQNLWVVCGEAVVFTKFYLPKHSIEEMFVNFPDPWPKLRHAKHRLVREEFLAALETVLTPKAKALFTTDDPVHREQMLEVLLARELLKPSMEHPHFALGGKDFGASYFSTLWLAKGRSIFHIPFEMT